MATKRINIPQDTHANLKVGDQLNIAVIADCDWCYSDPDNCFSGGLLAPGCYTATNPHTVYGPYTATADGTVDFNAVTSGPCTTSGVTATGHTIVVSG